MIKNLHTLKHIIVPSLLFILFFNCNTENDTLKNNVQITSPSLEKGGDLSINASARFDGTVKGLEGTPNLRFEWSTSNSRGSLSTNNENLNTQNTTSFVTVRGDVAGEELVNLKVYLVETGALVGSDSFNFNITAPSGNAKCYTEPLLFYRNNVWENPAMIAIGLQSSTRKATQLTAQNWLMDISPDGNWFVRQDFTNSLKYQFWLDSCDNSKSTLLIEGKNINSPTFSPDGKYIYYSEMISYPEQTQDPRAVELVRLDINTKEKTYVTEFRVFSSDPKISPDGNWIAFKHSRETFNTNGTYAGSITHLAIIPVNGGSPKFLVQIQSNQLDGFNWSPDSKDIIFNWRNQSGSTATQTNGIYRVYINGGGAPFLIYPEPKGGGNPTYYANGTRIAFHGYPSGTDTQYDIWSVDANGQDLKRLTNESYNVFLQFIWEP